MKRQHKRIALIAGGLVVMGVATTLVLNAFQSNLVFFFTPTQVSEGEAPLTRKFRIGGLVQEGSVERQSDGLTVRFTVTDTAKMIPVSYSGMLPDLFSEGKGVVAQGKLDEAGLFRAEEVLARHDENYMPSEAQHALDQVSKNTKMMRP